MKKVERFQKQIRGLFDAIYRFPLTTIFLVILVIFNALYINDTIKNPEKFIASLIVGVLLAAVAQIIYERFFSKFWEWIFLMALAIILFFAYYFVVFSSSELDLKLTIKTAVILSVLFMAFIWGPSIKSEVMFHQSFMVNFKAFFISLFFALVFFAGVSIILGAVDQLLLRINYRLYSHGANIIFALFAPMYYLSITPKYPGKAKYLSQDIEKTEEERDALASAISCPKYLMILISYIIIPITMVFTVILILYIFLNIGKDFWTNNLLEPMLVAYAITVIIVYLLSSSLENKVVLIFRKIFPKILIPIVLLQTVSSIMRISNGGISHGRYYVIIFGLFALFSGIIFSTRPSQSYGSIAGIFILLSIISIFPGINAFSVSKRSQTKVVERILLENGMLVENQLIPKNTIPEEDKEVIRKSISNLNIQGDLDDINWLPADFNYYSNFAEVFGFEQYAYEENGDKYLNLSLSRDVAIPIAGYDAFLHTNIEYFEEEAVEKFLDEAVQINIEGKVYELIKNGKENNLVLKDEKGQEMLALYLSDFIDYFKEIYYKEEMLVKGSELMTAKEATYTVESNQASLTVIVNNFSLHESLDAMYFSADIYIFIDIIR